ncbi:BatD family protein [Fulvivirga sedimenti]|uniref:BatD family protein n=1 Tax=Fulvivirga sedimenti TaxID=2879465 RepID=A0A9X1HXF9_9BACT|nr:BatD family protein [Fulvivirga sedimenti]MCA6078239.1 BatD family protein [Fulvivirga sedimenti]
MSLIHRYKKFLTVFWILILPGFAALAQDVSIELGPDEIGENQAWTITITISNDKIEKYSDFPNIEGFIKRGTSSASRTQIINGQVSSTQSVTMTYIPDGQGTYTVPPFEMTVNDKTIRSEGRTVKVGAAVDRQPSRDPFRDMFDKDPFDSFFGEDNATEYVDVKEDAFLALTTNKEEVYVGEGFTTTLSFYVADNNRAPLEFHELGKQLSDIMKQLRPENCWEENFNIENIYGEHVMIQGKGYTQYKIYQGVFFPLNTENVVFPSVGLDMIKYKVARNPSFFGQNRQEDFKKFFTRPKTVRVRDLPPHPLKDAVAVGDYKLNESVSSKDLQTGQSFTYEFNIYGEGNISSINAPMVKENDEFEFYDPDVSQNINRRNGRVTGSKSYSFYGIPNEPGDYPLGKYFKWIYFNIKKDAYDTLTSRAVVYVTGESRKNENILSSDVGTFYDRIEFERNDLSGTEGVEWLKVFANILILVMLALSAFIIFKK